MAKNTTTETESTETATASEAAAGTETTATATAAAANLEKRFRVQIPSSPRPGGNKDVTLTVNGRIVVVQRDVEVLLTEPYLEALRNAKERGYEGKADVPRYPYILQGEVMVDPATLDTHPTAGLDGTSNATS